MVDPEGAGRADRIHGEVDHRRLVGVVHLVPLGPPEEGLGGGGVERITDAEAIGLARSPRGEHLAPDEIVVLVLELQDDDLQSGPRKRQSHGCAGDAAADDDDVVVVVHELTPDVEATADPIGDGGDALSISTERARVLSQRFQYVSAAAGRRAGGWKPVPFV